MLISGKHPGLLRLVFLIAFCFTLDAYGAQIDKNPGEAAGSVSQDSAATINAAIAAQQAKGGGIVELPAGTYTVRSPVVLKTGIHLRGAGLGITVLKAAEGANLSAVVKTEDFDSLKAAGASLVNAPHDYGIQGITIDGSYLAKPWNSLTNKVLNSSGYGIKSLGYGFRFDVELINIPEVGALFEGEGSPPTTQDVASSISIQGRVFGKEAFIIRGPGDIEVEKLWLGLCGILPCPIALTTRPSSSEYPGAPVDGVVLDGVTLEADTWHVYACWAGIGVRTRDSVRLEANHIISESNNGGIYLSSKTYGMISKLSIRNNGIYYPAWKGKDPVYDANHDGYDVNWDACTIESRGFQIPAYFNFRSVVPPTRVQGWKSLVLTRASLNNRIGFSHRNSTDRKSGTLNSGDAIHILGNGNVIDASLDSVNGNGIVMKGSGNVLTFTDRGGINGYAVVRDAGANNEYEANTISGSVIADSKTRAVFNSLRGAPVAERISLTFHLPPGGTAFAGALPNVGCCQFWSIGGKVGESRISTDFSTSFSFDETITSEQTITVPHGFLYTPNIRQVNWSLGTGRSGAAVIDYIRLFSTSSRDLVFKLKLSKAASGRSEASSKIDVHIR